MNEICVKALEGEVVKVCVCLGSGGWVIVIIDKHADAVFVHSLISG